MSIEETSVESSKIGLIAAIATAAGSAVGGAMFVTPAVAGATAGPVIVILVPVTLFVAILLLPAYFTLLKTNPISAAHYHYISRLLIPENKMVSQLVSWCVLWSSLVLGGFFFLQFMVTGGADFLNAIFPAVSTNVFSAAILAMNFVIVWFGLRMVGRAEIVISAIMFVTVILVVLLGIPQISVDNLTPIAPTGVSNVFSGAAMIYFMISGAIIMIDISGGVRDAETTMTKAITSGLTADALAGLLISVVTVGVVSYTQLEGQTVAFVAEQFLSGRLTLLIGIGVLLAGITSNLASIPLFTRYAMAMSDDNILPEIVGKRNKHGEPMFLLIAMFGASIVFIFVDLPIEVVANGYSFVPILLTFLIAVIGVRLPTTHPEIFENQQLRSSRLLRPRVVRWSSLGAMIVLSILFVYLAIDQQVAFLFFLAAVFSGVIFYIIRSWQVGMETMLSGEIAITRNTIEEND